MDSNTILNLLDNFERYNKLTEWESKSFDSLNTEAKHDYLHLLRSNIFTTREIIEAVRDKLSLFENPSNKGHLENISGSLSGICTSLVHVTNGVDTLIQNLRYDSN